MALVTIATFRYRHEADLAKSILEENGIACVVSADDAGGWRPEILSANPVRVLVDESDAANAREVLASSEEDSE